MVFQPFGDDRPDVQSSPPISTSPVRTRPHLPSSNQLRIDVRLQTGGQLTMRSKRFGIQGQALFLDTFSGDFMTLLHTSTMSQMIPDIHGYSRVFPVSEGMSF